MFSERPAGSDAEMGCDKDIERAALHMLCRFGEGAAFRAARRVHELVRDGCPNAAAHWDKVQAELERMHQVMAQAAPLADALAEADLIVREQEERLARQEMLVEQLKLNGQSTSLAHDLLVSFAETLRLSRLQRALRRAEVGLPPDKSDADCLRSGH